VYYPRRENELTFKGNFWVNDTTWAIKKINLEMAEDANVNWVKQIYIEKEFDVLNDSVFLIKKDFFMADLALNKDEESGGFYGKRTVIYDDYIFNEVLPQEFYDQEVYRFNKEVYNRNEAFWAENRLEELNENEIAVYQMLDTLKSVKAFRNLFNLTTILATGYVEMDGWDFGPVFSSIGYNEVEGLRLRVGGRTYFTQNDTWRIEGYTAYGFKDDQFKYGILGKVLLEPKYRVIASLGRRRDIEQLGASLTNSVDILGRSYASSALLNAGDNDKLSSIEVTTGSIEIEPWNNFTFRVNGSLRDIKPASEGFSFNYFTDESLTQTASTINQTEFSTIFTYTPRRKTSGFGVEQNRVGKDFPTFFLSYSLGIKDLLESDFDYERLQFFYDQPLMIGGFGRAHARLEAGKIFGQVPLALLGVIPGNQSYFQNKNSFNLLNYYEFVTDTYVTFHFEHNFNGRLFSRIPGIRELNLREIVGIRAAWGQISNENKAIDASGLALTAPSEEPYWEYSFGISNIFKILRFDAHFRGNYFDNPEARSFAITGSFDIHF
ncbi:MAG TPA: DUF5686 family protein, partial [Salinimicrobium sp.]|nr:DUF5686 family protein [Salinimicrobium sp.]